MMLLCPFSSLKAPVPHSLYLHVKGTSTLLKIAYQNSDFGTVGLTKNNNKKHHDNEFNFIQAINVPGDKRLPSCAHGIVITDNVI